MEEKIFFNKDGVIVSNSRFVVQGQAYAMSRITSVTSAKHENNPSRIGPLVLIFSAIITFFWAFVNVFDSPEAQIIRDRSQPNIVLEEFFIGFVLSISGVLWWRIQKRPKPTYDIILNSSSDTTLALTGNDKKYIETIITALNGAIVFRG